MKNSVTAKEVAQRANVSTATVSRVFNGQGNVDDMIRRRVIEAATELDYFKKNERTGLALPSKKYVHDIGFLLTLHDVEETKVDPFWAHILHGVESEAQRLEMRVAYHGIGVLSQSPHLLLARLHELRFDGILLVGPASLETVRIIRSVNPALVLIDHYIPGIGIDAVLSANFEGARAAIEYLLSTGHRRIAFIGGPVEQRDFRPVNTVYSIECSASGYRLALADAGIAIDYTLFETSNFRPEGGYEACQRLLARGVSFDALFCANDPVAIGAMRALHEAGLRVPDDVSVIGFDDDDLAAHLIPPLTTVAIDKEAMGILAFKTLLNRINGPGDPYATHTVQVELMKRGTVIPRP